MDIRYTRGLDELCLHEWIRNPKMIPSVPCEYDEEIKNFSRTWMYYAAKKAGLSLVVEDHNVGMGVFILMPYQKVSHHALLQLIIDPKHFKKGFGSMLLKNMLHLAKTYFNLEEVFMELIGPKESSHFFEKRGFKVYAIQKGYVEGPYPDKILLCYTL